MITPTAHFFNTGEINRNSLQSMATGIGLRYLKKMDEEPIYHNYELILSLPLHALYNYQMFLDAEM